MRLNVLSWILAGTALLSAITAQTLGQQCPGGSCQDASYCSGGYCGGIDAYCTPEDAATQCRPGYQCLKNRCSNLTPAAIGATCYADQQCPGNSQCSPTELICGGELSYCQTADGLLGPSSDCVTGYQCINSRCNPMEPLSAGESCNAADPYTSRVCAEGLQCSSIDSTCGGLITSCYADDGTDTGPSKQCKIGLACLKRECTFRKAVALGGQCSDRSQCEGNTYCEEGICGGEGAYCSEVDNYLCAPTLTCQKNSCSRLPPVALGGACVTDVQCPADTTCSQAGVCGGVDSSCRTDDGTNFGDSVNCAPGNTCLYGSCSPFATVIKGGTCLFDAQCADRLDCSLDGICGGLGAYCYTGQQDDDSRCANNNKCVNSYCARRSSALGQACGGTGECANDPDTGVRPYCSFSATSICGGEGSYCSAGTPGYCAPGYNCLGSACTAKTTNLCSSSNSVCTTNFQCSNGVCGGLGAPCTVRAGSTTGSSPNCATNYICLQDTCTPERMVALGGACGSDRQCPSGITCGSGVCGGPDARCTNPDGQDVGISAQCTSGYNCLDGRCAALPIRASGQTCSFTEQCQGDLYCSGGICGGQNSYCSDSSLCADGYSCNKYSQCSKLPQAASGDTCSNDSQCPGDIRCSKNVCGGQDAFCDSDSSKCAPNYTCLRDNRCSFYPPKQLDEDCLADEQCPAGVACTRGKCGGPSGYCDTETDCGAGLSCLRNSCSTLTLSSVGGQCTSDLQCPSVNGRTVYCRQSICGGYYASCENDDPTLPYYTTGPSAQCASGYICARGYCSPRPFADVGDACGVTEQCLGQSECSQNICGGPGASCLATDGSPSGPSAQCDIGLNCLNYRCVQSDLGNALGESCNNDAECGDGVSCSDSGICGGIGALCEGNQFCDSNNCDPQDFVCVSGASPLPPGRKRDLSLQRRTKASLCPAAQIPCPVYPKGFECIDPMSNLEGCGGCAWGQAAGVDCTALPNVEDVDCHLGKCIIKSCVDGYTYQQGNQTCVFDL